MDELLRKSPRVAPEDGGAILFNASPRVAPSEGAAPLTSSTRVKPLWRSEASPRIAPDGGGAILFNASPRVAPVGVPEGAAPVPRVEPSRASPRVAPSDGGGAFLFNASPRVAPEGAPVRTQASQPQGASPRVAPAGGGEILFNASPRIAPDGIPVQSQASRASPRIAPIGGPAAPPPPRTDKRPGRCDACGWRTCQCPPPPPTWQPQYEQNPLHDTEALLMEEAKPPPQKPMGRGEAWALSGDVLLRSLRLWADMATITEWALQGRTFPSFCGLSGFAIGRIMEIAMADATYPKEVIGAAFGFGLASHARKSANTGRRTEAYAMLRLVTTACAAPTALGRFYQLGGRGELNWLDICGCTLDVVDASIAAGAATLGAGAIWKRIRSKAARTGQLVGLSIGYAAENILRLAAYAAVLRGAVPIYVLLFSTGDFLFVLVASCGCARHDRRGRGTRGRAFVRAILWLYADMPLDYDRHRRMGWAHAVLVVGHGWLFGWACLFYREASPLARWCSTREAHLHLVLFLLSLKVVVFAGFWLAYAYESAGDARLEDHVVVTPLDLRKGDESSIELRSMFPTRRKPTAAASPRRPRASRDEAAGWWPRLSPRKSPRVAPADGGGAFLFNASPRVAPEGVPVRTQA